MANRSITPEQMNLLFWSRQFIQRVEASGRPSADVFLESTDDEVSEWLDEGARAQSATAQRSEGRVENEGGMRDETKAAQIFCPNCGPIRRTIARTSARTDMDRLAPGPIPRSKCGKCGSQLHVGQPNTSKQEQHIGAATLEETKGDVTRLSDGIAEMPRRLIAREIRADNVFLYLQFISRFLPVATAILGFSWRSWPGMVTGLVLGWLIGRLMRYSVGIRGSDPVLGFFLRMQQRADGSRPGILERLIERIRGYPFTRANCTEIASAFSTAETLLAKERSVEARTRILRELDAKVKAVSYRK